MKFKPNYILIIATILILAIFASYYYFIINVVSGWPTRGQIGDTFGAPNAFLSGIAIIGVIYSLIQQNEVLKHEKIEIDNSITQFKESVYQFEQQQKIQALISLIAIYEKRLEQYKMINDLNLQVETNSKLTKFILQLEEILTNI